MSRKKILIAGLIATMVMGNSVVSFADTGTAIGEGTLEGTVETDVFSVELPVVDTSSLAFTLDPEGLVAKTEAAAKGENTDFDEGTLYFKNVIPAEEEGGEATIKYTNTSDKLTIVNTSSVAVDVSVTAEVSDAEGITFSEDKAFTDDTSTSIYLAIKDSANEKAIKGETTEVNAQIAQAPDGSYEYTWSADDGYEYKLIDDLDGIEFEKYEFQLTGASNSAGDWSNLAAVAPKVELTWKVEQHVDVVEEPEREEPEVYVSSTQVSVGKESVTLNSPEGVTISSVVLHKTDKDVTLVLGDTYTLVDKTLGIKAAIVSAYPGRTITVTFSDGHVETLTIK